jgi:hypothetical protein
MVLPGGATATSHALDGHPHFVLNAAHPGSLFGATTATYGAPGARHSALMVSASQLTSDRAPALAEGALEHSIATGVPTAGVTVATVEAGRDPDPVNSPRRTAAIAANAASRLARTANAVDTDEHRGAQRSSTVMVSGLDDIACQEPSVTLSPESTSVAAGTCKSCPHKGVKMLVMRPVAGRSVRAHEPKLMLSSEVSLEAGEFNFRTNEHVAANVSRLLDRGNFKVKVGSKGADRSLIRVGSLPVKKLAVAQSYTLKDGRYKLVLAVDKTDHRGPDSFQITLLFCYDCGRLLEFHWNGVLDPLQPPDDKHA